MKIWYLYTSTEGTKFIEWVHAHPLLMALYMLYILFVVFGSFYLYYRFIKWENQQVEKALQRHLEAIQMSLEQSQPRSKQAKPHTESAQQVVPASSRRFSLPSPILTLLAVRQTTKMMIRLEKLIQQSGLENDELNRQSSKKNKG